MIPDPSCGPHNLIASGLHQLPTYSLNFPSKIVILLIPPEVLDKRLGRQLLTRLIASRAQSCSLIMPPFLFYSPLFGEKKFQSDAFSLVYLDDLIFESSAAVEALSNSTFPP